MTVCYAYEYNPGGGTGNPCVGCGHYYWEHSHWLATFTDGTARRIIIGKYEAMDHYDWHHASREPGADTRPRYEMMMDRQPHVLTWVTAQMNKETDRQADEFLDSLADITGYRTAGRAPSPTAIGLVVDDQLIYVPVRTQWADPRRPLPSTYDLHEGNLPELTTHGDRYRRFLLPNGAILVTRILAGEES